MAQRLLRIAYVTTGCATDVNNWSGLVKHIRDALITEGHELHDVEVLAPPIPLQTRIRGYWTRFAMRTPYGYDRDVDLARSVAQCAETKLRTLEPDCIVAPRTYPITMLRTEIPTASWGDATFQALLDLYPGYMRISKGSIRQGHYIERRAIERASFLAYASGWAAKSAIDHYGADPAKVAVIPFGANCREVIHTREAAEESWDAKPSCPFRMLFLGADWERKGGPLAVATLRELRRRGLDVELWVAGSDPFAGDLPEGVRCFGRLDKADAAQLAQFEKCFLQCHVFFMPTTAEAFGLVFAEAAAFALASISKRIGGVPNAVADGRSGILLAAQAGPIEFANVLEDLVRDLQKPRQLGISAYGYYREALNWNSAGRSFSEQLLARLDLKA